VGTSSGRDLTGRDQELDVLAGLIGQVSEHGSAIAVLGEPGIGKSSLLRPAADCARQAGLQVLVTTGIETEAQLPFAGLHQLLRPVLGAAESLPSAQRRALRSAFGAEDGPPPEPFMIALAALNLLADAAGRRPVLLAVDDVQWLDEPSQEVLTFIARRVGVDPVVLIGTVRKEHDIPFTHAGLPELDVPGLDAAASRDLLAARAGDLTYPDQERILAEALGNPLALVELPAALRVSTDRGPDLNPIVLPLTARLERAFAARVADLPTGARDAVLIAAVDYADDLPEILAGATALAGQQVSADDLQQAAAAGLIRVDGLRVRFRHPLVRSAVLQQEPATRRQAANAALASVLRGEPYRRT
jgi:hypothetical protein